eukprot:scaffold2312_cov165-Ochromonas_danica.AAC.34
MVLNSADKSRGSSHVAIIRGLKESPQALALRALKAISKSLPSSLIMDAVPSEILFGEVVDLHRWTIIVNDETLNELSQQQSSGKKYYLESSSDTLSGMFRSFWRETVPQGLLKLNISGAKDVTDFGISTIAQCSPLLVSLTISSCTKVTDTGLREVAMRCPMLQDLDISSCPSIEGQGLAAIAECCPNMLLLNVSKCVKLKNWSLQKIFRGCQQLESVSVSYIKDITDEEIRVLAENCPDLSKIEAVECLYLSDQCVLSIAQNCKGLDFLDLSRTDMTYRISDVCLMALGQKTQSLRYLKLNHCDQVSDVGLGWLVEGCQLIEQLELSGCDKITDAGLRVLGNNCHALTSLDISRAKAVSDVGIASLARGCPQLRTLRCSGLFLLSDPSLASYRPGRALEAWEEVIGVAAISKQCPNMEMLDLSGCFRLNRFIGQFLCNLSGLIHLNLKGCNQCLPTSLLALAPAVPRLEVLNLSDCGKAVTNKVLQAFAQHCPKIASLYLCRCEDIKEAGIKAVSNLNQLKLLDLSGCRSLTDSMLVPLSQIDRVPELYHMDVTHCPRVGDSFLAWMSLKQHRLLYFCLQGSSTTRKALMSVRDRFPLCDLLINDNFFGFWAKHRVRDRMLLNSYQRMITGVTKIQARLRKHMAKNRVKGIFAERRRLAAQFLLQRIARGFLARCRTYRARAFRKRVMLSAICITSVFRCVVARKRLARKKAERLLRRKHYAALTIQCAYRRHVGALMLWELRQEALRRKERRLAASIIIQSFGRLVLAKAKMLKIRALKRNRVVVTRRKAIIIQSHYRGYVSRQRTKKYKAALEAARVKRLQSAIAIQRRFRLHRTNQIVNQGQLAKRNRLRAAMQIQALVRGSLTRLHVMEMRMEQWVITKRRAVLRIQCRWRVFKARCEFFRRIKERMETRAALTLAANRIVRQARVKLACLKVKQKRAEYIARLTAQAQLEISSATKIQAMIRSHQGRKIYYEKLKEKKGMWKELFDEEKKKRFFYNKLTGEVRWRIPKDLLDLIPHPICDNCLSTEAVLECSVCNEQFCGLCFQEVHRGGRRAGHEYRALYDYYGKRLDYGDGEYPCQWPSDIVQDEIQGWMLRINPYRKPVEVFDCGWEKYEDQNPGKRTLKNIEEWRVKDSMGQAAPKTLYFNRSTFQTSYEMPEEVAIEVAAKTGEYNAYNTSNGLLGSPNTYYDYDSQQGYGYSARTFEQGADPNDASWYFQGYYDENGNWIDYNNSNQTAVVDTTAPEQVRQFLPISSSMDSSNSQRFEIPDKSGDQLDASFLSNKKKDIYSTRVFYK